MKVGPNLGAASQEAYRHLREQILCGEFPGGAKIDIAEIAKRLALSRMPVREALHQLGAEGLVSLRPNRAAIVTRLTAVEVDELFEIRAALEKLAVRYAVPALTRDSFAEIVSFKERMDRVRNDPLEWIKRHDELHQAICELGNRKHLAQEIARIRQVIRPYTLMYLKVYNEVEMPGHEHTSLLEALGSGDVERAQREMYDHVINPRGALVAFLHTSGKAEAAGHIEAADQQPRRADMERSEFQHDEQPGAASINI